MKSRLSAMVSATGGVEALEQLLGSLPHDFPMQGGS